MRVVLAAGQGTRLRPLTESTPKALCPVGNVPLLDRALARLARHGLRGPAQVAVNACYLADRVVAHVGGRAFISAEPDGRSARPARVGNLRDWMAGRAVLVGNADAYLAPDGRRARPGALLDGWDGRDRTRARRARRRRTASREFAASFGPARFAGFSLLPADVAAALPPVRSELVREVWRPAERGRPAGGDPLRRLLPRHRDAWPTTWPPTCTPPAPASLVAAGARW